MDLNLNINFNFGKHKNHEEQKSKKDRKYESSNDQSNLEKWLETAQKIVKSISIN